MMWFSLAKMALKTGAEVYKNKQEAKQLESQAARNQMAKMASGEFVVGDFSQGSQVFQRENLTVDFGYENNDNFDKYLVSVRGIIRMAHAIYLPNAFVKGSFSTAITALETS